MKKMLLFESLNTNSKLKYISVIFIIFLKIEYSFCKWNVWDMELEWWQKSIIYQIYPRSFQDSDGDGVGDLKGIESRLDYIKETGIDTVWLSPIFKSPNADLGYDIADFKDIDPLFGTLDDFNSLVKEIKNRGLYLLLDYVPNHTSDEHEWFLKSIKRIDPYTDYYVWKDGRVVNDTKTYPNNWLSVFGKSGWTFNEERGQYYYHQFNAKQPDLNLTNSDVKKEMEDVLRFWLDLGVDGFRVDAVRHLIEDPEFNDEPCLPQYEGACEDDYMKMIHNHTTDWPDTYELVNEWRKFIDEYKENSTDKQTRVILSEAYSKTSKVMQYYGNETNPGAHMPLNFFLVLVRSGANSSEYLQLVNEWFDNMPEGCWPNWVVGNHDNHRIATKMGKEMVDAFFMLSMLLPGTAVTYQGDELGQPDTMVRPDQVRDPNNSGVFASDVRDPERGPFMWDDTENAGFTTTKIPWEPAHPSYWEMNLEAQKNSSKSHYKVYKQISELRKKATIQKGDLVAKNVTTWVFAFARRLPGDNTYVTVINFGSETESVFLSEYIPNVPTVLYVIISSINSGYEEGETITTKVYVHAPSKPLVLRPKASVVLSSNYAPSTNDVTTNATTIAPTTEPKSSSSNNINFTNNNKMFLFFVLVRFLFFGY